MFTVVLVILAAGMGKVVHATRQSAEENARNNTTIFGDSVFNTSETGI